MTKWNSRSAAKTESPAKGWSWDKASQVTGQVKRLLSIREAAELTGVHPVTIRRRIEAGELTAYRAGKRLIRGKCDDVLNLFRATGNTAA